MTQYIADDEGSKTLVVIAVQEYKSLLDVVEMEQDVRDFDQVMADNDKILPSEMVERLAISASKLIIWRDHRGFTQEQLAEKVGLYFYVRVKAKNAFDQDAEGNS